MPPVKAPIFWLLRRNFNELSSNGERESSSFTPGALAAFDRGEGRGDRWCCGECNVTPLLNRLATHQSLSAIRASLSAYCV